jgi:uncharacterized membrane protein YebE (DUF533 family)
MVDGRVILDALVGAFAQRMGGAAAQPGESPLANVVDQVLGPMAQGGRAEPYVERLRDFVSRNPGLAEAALTSVAGVLMRAGKSRGIALSAARLGGLGGLALVGMLAYKAYQNHQSGKTLLDMGQGGAKAAAPMPAAFDFTAATDDDALLFARAMVAAATADGPLDARERARIIEALSQAGIDPQATRWLEDELASPASVDDIADRVQTPEKAAQVYAAARLAIHPDTLQEREFLRQLAESLDVEPEMVRQIDDAAGSVRA